MSKTFTIFGGTGDLTYRKLLPALYNMKASKQLEQFQIVIIGRRNYQKQEYIDNIRPWLEQFVRLPFEETIFQSFCDQLTYLQMDFTKEEEYLQLYQFYEEHGLYDPVFYFAVAPRFFECIAKNLVKMKINTNASIVIEKPFGEDVISAKALNTELEQYFSKENIYHIDHYLGKEMVRNIQTIRLLNPMFRHLWNHNYIEHVQICALEEVGVENRGSYYDQSGALKDMVQNHLFQILSVIAMEELDTMDFEDLQNKQLDVLKQLRNPKLLSMKESMVLGQYEGYQQEPRVEANSQIETYAAICLWIDNERWKNTPFYIRTGKKLNRREMEVIITFKKEYEQANSNVLIIKIQPTEGVYMQFNIKKPGNSTETIPVSMDFCQSCFETNRLNTPEAYERLLYAVVQKDRSWFSKWEQIECSWNYVEQLYERWKEEQQPLVTYKPQTSGPKEANWLLERKKHAWYENQS